jgi:predicted ATP-dependent endonuclease of OLD family
MLSDFTLEEGYKSLPAGFKWNSINSLSVIIGLNGVGKTHLLEAIKKDQEKRGVRVSFITDKWVPEDFKGIKVEEIRSWWRKLSSSAESIVQAAKDLRDHPGDKRLLKKLIDQISAENDPLSSMRWLRSNEASMEDGHARMVNIEEGNGLEVDFRGGDLESVKFTGECLRQISSCLLECVDDAIKDEVSKMESGAFTIGEILRICDLFSSISVAQMEESLIKQLQENAKKNDAFSLPEALSDIFLISMYTIYKQSQDIGELDGESRALKVLQDLNKMSEAELIKLREEVNEAVSTSIGNKRATREIAAKSSEDISAAKTKALEKLGLVSFPWESLNELFAKYNSSIRLSEPEFFESGDFISHYTIKFKKDGVEKELEIADLSSGEKVIVNAFIMSYVTNMRGPSLLLLDESEASLNPALVNIFLDILKKEFVEKDVQIIATTHSAVTANLLLPENMFVMSLDGAIPSINSVTDKSEAVNLLTGNLLTINDNFGVVFTESFDDANFFQEVFEHLCSLGTVNSNLPLKFRPVANKIAGKAKNKGGVSHAEENGGKASVKLIVEKFRKVGLGDFVLGIIDSDKTAENPRGNVIKDGGGLVAPQQRHSIENYLCDPVILLFLISNTGLRTPKYDEFRTLLKEQGETDNFFNKEDLQSSLNNFFETVLTKLEKYHKQMTSEYGSKFSDNLLESIISDIKSKDVENVTYENGTSVEMPKSFLNVRGHDLSRVMLIALQDQKIKIKKNADLNNNELVASFKKLSELQTGFIPRDLADSMKLLQTYLNKESQTDIEISSKPDEKTSEEVSQSNIEAIFDGSTASVTINYHGVRGSTEYYLYKSHTSALNDSYERGLISVEKRKSEDSGVRSLVIGLKEGEGAQSEDKIELLKRVVENLGVKFATPTVRLPSVTSLLSQSSCNIL